MKKVLSLALALVMCLGLTVPAFAELEGEAVELREGVALVGVVGDEMIAGSPVGIQLYKVGSYAALDITGCGQLDEYGSSRRASIFVGIYEAKQNGPDEPADWNWDENGPYIPGAWVVGEVIEEMDWTENGVKVFDESYAGKTVYLTINEEWESTGTDNGNGLPSSGWTEVMVQFPDTEPETSAEPEPPAEPETPAYQVSDWAKERVALAVETGLAPEGLGNDYRVNITRAQFAATAVKLYEAMGGTAAPAGENPFNDTTDPVIIQAAELGFVSGVGGGRFSPDALVTREQAALMLTNVYIKLGGEVPAVEATSFADNDSVSGWARNAVAFMSDNGIVSGVGNNNFGPQGNASIEQALLIALRMFENLK